MKKILSVIVVLLMLVGCTTSNYCYNNGYSCGSTKVITEPVEVIYRKTTYRTVYEPKTYKSVSYVKIPYNNCYRQNNVNYCK